MRVLGLHIVILGRLPEIGQDHQTIFVGQVEEALLGILAHPVADDVEVRVAVQAEERLQMGAVDALHEIVHADITAARRDPHAVDPQDEIGGEARIVGQLGDRRRLIATGGEAHRPAVRRLADTLVTGVHHLRPATHAVEVERHPLQIAVIVEQRQVIGHLPHAEAKRLAVGQRPVDRRRQRQIVQRGIAIAIGPPEARIFDRQLREFAGRQDGADRLARRHRHRLFDHHIVEHRAHRRRHRHLAVIGDGHRDLDIGDRVVGLGQRRHHLRVADHRRTGRGQSHALPQPGIAIPDGGNPVPALGRDESRAVHHLDAAILADARRHRFLMRDAGVRRRRDTHRDGIASGGQRDRETTPDEGALHRAHHPAIDPDLGGIVHAVEGQPHRPPGGLGGRVELGAVPVILPRQRLRDGQVVQPDRGIGIDTAIDQRGQHRTWHGRRIPFARVEIALRQVRAAGTDLGRLDQPPAVHRPLAGRGGDERGFLGFGLGRTAGRDRGLGLGQRPGVLRCRLPLHLAGLIGPGRAAGLERDLRGIRGTTRGDADGQRIDRLAHHAEVGDLARKDRLVTAWRQRRDAGDGLQRQAALYHLAAAHEQPHDLSVITGGNIGPFVAIGSATPLHHARLGDERGLAVDQREIAARAGGGIAEAADQHRRALARDAARLNPGGQGPVGRGDRGRHDGPAIGIAAGGQIGVDRPERRGRGRRRSRLRRAGQTPDQRRH